MKIRLYSDIHNEIRRSYKSVWNNHGWWIPVNLPDDKETILILAGDIDKAYYIPSYLNMLSDRFKVIIHVNGNHEYYRGNIHSCNEKVAGRDEKLNDNVYHLNNETLIVDGVRFIGGTMWTDLSDPINENDCSLRMNDYHVIRHGTLLRPFERKLTPADTTIFHKKWKTFILEELNKEFDGKTVIITHHSPLSPQTFNMGRDVRPTDYAYHACIENLILDYKPDLWVFGHTHECSDVDFYGTRIVANCVGYFSEENDYTNDIIEV